MTLHKAEKETIATNGMIFHLWHPPGEHAMEIMTRKLHLIYWSRKLASISGGIMNNAQSPQCQTKSYRNPICRQALHRTMGMVL